MRIGSTRVVAVILAALSAAGCAASAPATPATDSCTPASDSVVAAVSARLDSGLSLRDAQIVKSKDPEEAYFVSGELEGSPVEGAEDRIATWMTNSPNGKGDIFAVGTLAGEFSDWELREFNLSDSGALAATILAITCAEAS